MRSVTEVLAHVVTSLSSGKCDVGIIVAGICVSLALQIAHRVWPSVPLCVSIGVFTIWSLGPWPLELPKISVMAKNATLEMLPQWKITEIVATRCQILRLKCTKLDFCWLGGAYSAPQTPSSIW